MKRRLPRILLALALLALAGFAALNVLAYRHACAMMRYSSGGPRTDKPEALTTRSKLRVLLVGVHLPRPTDERPPTALAPDAQILAIPVSGDVTLSAWYAGRSPDAPLAIFFHGYSTEKTRLLREAREIHALGASVLLVDFRGSGGSSEDYTTLGLLEADDVAAAVRFAQARLPHSALVLYGQSMGSAAILRAIHVHGVAPDAVVLESVFDSMLGTIRNRFDAMGVPSFPNAELLTFWGGRRFGFDGFAHDPVDYAHRWNAPRSSCTAPTIPAPPSPKAGASSMPSPAPSGSSRSTASATTPTPPTIPTPGAPPSETSSPLSLRPPPDNSLLLGAMALPNVGRRRTAAP